MKKTGVVLVAFAIVLIGVFTLFYINYYNFKATGNVVSGVSSDPNQTILKIYSQNNTHGELWNGTNYNFNISYDQIFGTTYSGSNPHACASAGPNPSNKVLGLSSNTNAHAEDPSESNYATNVCYGNLTCKYLANANNCSSLTDASYKAVVSLSAQTNAHLAIPGYYNNQICCTENAVAPPPTTTTAPIVIIDSPENGDIYFTNEDISFNQSSYDPNGNDISYQWNIDEGPLINESNFTYQYKTPGVKKITLKVTNNLSTSNQTSISILIASIGTNIFPIINTPAEGSKVTNMNVFFNGSSSYILNISNSSSAYAFDCLGGACPTNVSGYCGSSCPLITDTLSQKGNYSEIKFNWTFGDDPSYSQSAFGLSSGNNTYQTSGPQIISLILSYSGLSATTFNNFVISGNPDRGCRANGFKYWDGSTLLNTLNSNAACLNLGAGIDKTDCCPNQYSCLVNTSGGSYCSDQCNNLYYDAKSSSGVSAITLCAQYNNITGNSNMATRKAQCIDDCADARASNANAISLPAGQHFDDFQCAWVDANNSCNFFYNTTSTSYSYGLPITIPVNNGTVWNLLSDSGCQDGYETITWCEQNASLDNNVITNETSGCTAPQTTQIPCEEGKINLPFFENAELFVSSIIIILIYLFYKKRHNYV